MRWEKRGRVYAPAGDQPWARSHAYLPTVHVREDRLRVYFAALDAERFGRIGYVDLDPADPTRVLSEPAVPVLDLGEPGTFDDSGVSPSCVLDVSGELRLFYVGWQRAVRVPYMLFAGVATSHDGGESFARWAPVPVLDRTPAEPFIRSATTIVADDGGGMRMWYVSAREWVEVDGAPTPTYIVRTATSRDGFSWDADEGVCIEFADAGEYGFGRPWVLHEGGRYRMWYSIRSRSHPYRIGYAESGDGLSWTRMDNHVGIAASATGWDSEMICFPCVVDSGGRRYMFYNGNRHGATGFGYAELVQDR